MSRVEQFSRSSFCPGGDLSPEFVNNSHLRDIFMEFFRRDTPCECRIRDCTAVMHGFGEIMVRISYHLFARVYFHGKTVDDSHWKNVMSGKSSCVLIVRFLN